MPLQDHKEKKMEIKENSSEAMLLLMLCAINMDGKIRYEELVLYNQLAEKLGLKEETIEDLVIMSDKDPLNYGKKAREAITDPVLRKSILINMTLIALIDKEFHPYERALLDSLEKSWDLKN